MKNLCRSASSIPSQYKFCYTNAPDILSGNIESTLNRVDKKNIQKNLFEKYGDALSAELADKNDSSFLGSIKNINGAEQLKRDIKKVQGIGLNKKDDGVFGPSTRLIIAYHQFKNKGEIDGKWGPESARLYNELEQKEAIVVVDESTKEQTGLSENVKQTYYEITLPDWFVDADNDAVRVATLNKIAKGFEQFGRRSNGGGNEAKIIKALKSIHSEAFADMLSKGEPLIVSTKDLAEKIPGLKSEDYQRILILLEKVSKEVVDVVDEAFIDKFNDSGNASAREIDNAGLGNKTLLVDTTWGDLPLEVEVHDDSSGGSEYVTKVFGGDRIENVNLTREEVDMVVSGEMIDLPKEKKVLVQAQGKLFKLEKGDADIKRFRGEDGRDINLDKSIFDGLTIPQDLQNKSTMDGTEVDYSGTSAEASQILSGAVHYLTSMLDTKELSSVMKVDEKGHVYMTGDIIQEILQKVLNDAVDKDSENALAYSIEDISDGLYINDYYVDKSKVNAITHRAVEKLFEKDNYKLLQWNINRITNSDFDRSIEGATMKEKMKFFGITIKELERELSRDEFVSAGARTDYFEVFERKMNTDLQKLLLDNVINNPQKYRDFEDAVVAMGETRWNKIQEDRGIFDKMFSNSLNADQIRNAKFRIGAYHLLQKSKKEGTDLATEFKRLYERDKTSITGIEKLFLNSEEKEALKAFGLLEETIDDILAVGMDKGVFANLRESNLSFGLVISGLNDGSEPYVPPTREELYSSTSDQTNVATTDIDTDTSTTQGDWIPYKNETWTEERNGYMYTYTRTSYKRKNTSTTTQTTGTTTNTTTQTTDVYKITKYKKVDPEKKVEITIDARQNLITIDSLPGVDFSLNTGIGGVLKRLDETAYMSLNLGAEGQLTKRTKINAGAGIKARADGEIINSVSLGMVHQMTDNLKLFAGVSSNSLDSFSELMDWDRATLRVGAEYSFNKWDLKAGVSTGNDLARLSIILKKNKKHFIEGLKKAISEISDAEADDHTRSIYGDNINVKKYRNEAKLFLGGIKYSNAVSVTLTKVGMTFAEVGTDKILSLVLGIATGADLVKHVMPQENIGHENFRAYLQQSGDYISKIRHSQKLEMEDLSVSEKKYRLLPEGYADRYLPQNIANIKKYVEVNVYIDPRIKDQVQVNQDGTFELKGDVDFKPFVLDKTLADGHTEINVYLGNYISGAFGSENLMSSGRVYAGGEFGLSDKLNTGVEREGSEKMLAERMGAFTALEKVFYEEMVNDGLDKANYNAILEIEKEFRINSDKEAGARVKKLVDSDYDDQIVSRYAKYLDQYSKTNGLAPHEVIASLVKARMKYDAVKNYGENFWGVENYKQFINKKRDFASKFTGKWKSAMTALGANVRELGVFADPKTALIGDLERDEKDVKSYSGGRGYIMAPNGEAVLLNKINATKVMHHQEKTITTPSGTYKIITGYLEECRNPMFIIQKIRPTGGFIVSDQENTAQKTGIDVHSIDFALGLRFTPPTVVSEVLFENRTSSSQSSNTQTTTDRWSDSYYEYREETTYTRDPLKEEPPTAPPVAGPL